MCQENEHQYKVVLTTDDIETTITIFCQKCGDSKKL